MADRRPLGSSVSLRIDAPSSDVWNLVADVTRIGEFSDETFEAEWLDGATGPTLGARFRGHVKRNQKGPTYWSTCEVTSCEPGRSFGFAVLAGGKPINNWRYDMKAVDGGTEVTESFELESTMMNRIYWAILGRLRGKTNEEGMRTTLERMKVLLERP
jgi:hypothetical protein